VSRTSAFDRKLVSPTLPDPTLLRVRQALWPRQAPPGRASGRQRRLVRQREGTPRLRLWASQHRCGADQAAAGHGGSRSDCKAPRHCPEFGLPRTRIVLWCRHAVGSAPLGLGPTRRACYITVTLAVALPVPCRRLPRDVLTWLMFGLVVWLGIGVLTARLVFGAFVSGSRHSRERD